eukprot:2111261-Amphidinium_carterae.1
MVCARFGHCSGVTHHRIEGGDHGCTVIRSQHNCLVATAWCEAVGCTTGKEVFKFIFLKIAKFCVWQCCSVACNSSVSFFGSCL